MTKTELYFGRDIKNIGVVSEGQFQAFVDTFVTPKFPDGLTILDAVGQFRGANGTIIHESSKIIILLHDGGLSWDHCIDGIREKYKTLFLQESVMRIDQNVEVSF